MIYNATAPSYKCGLRLAAAGCPLDYLENLRRNLRRSLYVTQLGGYEESRVFDLDGGQTAQYVIPLRIGTDLPSGAVIVDWSFELQWEQNIYWDHEPGDVVRRCERPVYEGLFDSRLRPVLDERRLLARGRPVTGLLCGYTVFESIPKSVANGTTVRANLRVRLDTGRTLISTLKLTVDRRAPRVRLYEKREGKLFDKRDVLDRESVSESQMPDADFVRAMEEFYALMK